MNIILSYDCIFRNENEVIDYLADGVHENDMTLNNAEAFKVGYKMVLVRLAGDDEFNVRVPRHALAGMLVNGKAVALHGPMFKRLGCVTTDEEYDDAVKALEDKRDGLIKTVTDAYENSVKALQDEREAYDKLINSLDDTEATEATEADAE